MPVAERERGALCGAGQSRGRFVVDFFTVEQHWLAVLGQEQVCVRVGRLGDRGARNQTAVHRYGQLALTGIEGCGVQDRRVKLCIALLRAGSWLPPGPGEGSTRPNPTHQQRQPQPDNATPLLSEPARRRRS